MIFYHMPGSCALATHIALEQAGAEYELKRVDFSKNEQHSPEYLGINPKGRVPALVTEQGILTETPALLAFIAQSYPEAHLAPINDPFRFAEVQAFNSYLCSTVHVAHAHGPRGIRWTDDPVALEAMKKNVPQTMSECFRLIEEEMFAGPWVMGNDYSISDIYLYTIARWLEADEVDIKLFPRISDHRKRMSEIPAIQQALASEQKAP